ncbi:YbhB/YbcL family Raf kinase inhibitor-like protein [Sphingomonas sp. MA1305]|uniref:YbhB/YbcL family Raf kinase inhibitor-like protein n=1 Tax=unclassified Sphingomonas TaxID=196159 RepID=UPI0018E0287F|nr:YbhB/YbcL family Raf kinase inhibitor-like protein [Sphingomonas sp. MA1305]MBI0475994.1 YbhB/YbcL family Raf kinase inhibitor-like protein [Sphingomonas sp. MA1305]
MLEHIPAWLGKALAAVRAGSEKLVIARRDIGHGISALELTSPAFADGGRLPPRFTADGAGVSPPLTWGTPPEGTASLVLIVEDADAPAPQPLVHAIVWGLPADAGRLEEGAIVADGDGTAARDVGRNSYFAEGWLPPDPPTGHGSHRYAFQLFALDAAAGDPGATPGRGAVVKAMAGHVLAAGVLVGTYGREEEAPIGPAGAAATA